MILSKNIYLIHLVTMILTTAKIPMTLPILQLMRYFNDSVLV